MKKIQRVDIGILYRTDGSDALVRPENGKKFSLGELQKAVGGYIEIAPSISSGRVTCYVNEEGLLENLPRNSTYPEYVGNVFRVSKTDPPYLPRTVTIEEALCQ